MPLHTEHLANVRPAWVFAGWLVAVAVSSLVALVLASLDIATAAGAADQVAIEARWALISIAVGFAVGGFSLGWREVDAPVLTGVAVGLTSLVAWVPINFVADLMLDVGPWTALTPTLTVLVLVVQMATAVGGAWIGHNLALRGETGLID